MISVDKKFVFIHIPKTGGNAIRLVLNPHSIDEIVIDEQQEAYNRDQGDVHRFSVRNPFIDLYKHAKITQVMDRWSEADFGPLQDYFKFAVIRNPWDRLISYYFSPHLNRQEFDREEFCDFIKSDMVKQQFEYIAVDGKVALDHLIRFESLAEEFSGVCERIGIPCTLRKVNQSNHRPYQDYYDHEILDVVREHHGKDIDFFGYTFQ